MSASGPSISVVLPFWDPPHGFMREAIESVIAQTCDDWELILSDDGSADVATGVARDYEVRFPNRVRYVAFPGREHRGLASARSLGLAAARGEFVALLDADDTWSPDKLERQRQLLRDEPRAAMVYGRSLYWFGWTGRTEDVARDYVQEHVVRQRQPAGWQGADHLVRPPALLVAFLRRHLAVPPPSSVMLRRAVVDEVGGPEQPFSLYEDQSLYAKVALRHPILVATEQWDRYRQHDASLCGSVGRSRAALRERRLYLEWLARYAREHGVRDRSLFRALQRERWRARLRPAARVIRSVLLIRPSAGQPGLATDCSRSR